MTTLYWDVRPRYSAGSPAMVDRRIAAKVLIDEWECLEHALAGSYGDAKRDEALADKLAGIVIVSHERGPCVDTWDVITGEAVRKRYRDGILKASVPLKPWDTKFFVEAFREELVADLTAPRTRQHAMGTWRTLGRG